MTICPIITKKNPLTILNAVLTISDATGIRGPESAAVSPSAAGPGIAAGPASAVNGLSLPRHHRRRLVQESAAADQGLYIALNKEFLIGRVTGHVKNLLNDPAKSLAASTTDPDTIHRLRLPTDGIGDVTTFWYSAQSRYFSANGNALKICSSA